MDVRESNSSTPGTSQDSKGDCSLGLLEDKHQSCHLRPWAIVLLCVVAAVAALALVFACRCARRKRRSALGPDHEYFQSINNQGARDSLMRQFMRQSQIPLLGTEAPIPPVRISSRPVDDGSNSGGLLAVTRSRSGTGAGLGLIDNDNQQQVEINEDPIGCGAAGDVLVGTWRGQKVAIKQLQTMNNSLDFKEAETLLRSFEREVKVRVFRTTVTCGSKLSVFFRNGHD